MVLVIVCQTVSGLLYFVASGGKYLENWLSHKASGYLTEYIAEAGLSKKRRTPLFVSVHECQC